MAYINEMHDRLAAAGGNAAKMALDSKLVDGLKTRDQLRQLMVERGARDKEGKTFRQVSLDGYLAHLKSETGGHAVGVIVAEGEIIDGKAQPGTVGGLSTSELVRKAREDEKIKAIVLRVNSPTGSIGAFGLLPTADKALDKIGIHTAGVTTTWLGGAADPRLPFNPRVGDLIQMSVNHVYTEFTNKAAQARKTTPEKIDEVGQGRMWSGAMRGGAVGWPRWARRSRTVTVSVMKATMRIAG
jgi:protease-4